MPETNTKNNTERVALRSEAVQEILGLVPHWMIRWGNTLVLFLVIGLFLVSYFIKYPDTITTEVSLTTAKPLMNMFAPIAGEFLDLRVSDGDEVSPNQVLAVIQGFDSQEQILRSSIKGKAYFIDAWVKDSHVGKGDLLFRVVPVNHEGYKAKMKISAQQLPSIAVHQKVKIRMTENLLDEQAVVEGYIQRIALVADTEGDFAVDVKLPDDLVTINGKIITFKPGVKGTAEIITEDLRLIERFFYQLKDIFNY